MSPALSISFRSSQVAGPLTQLRRTLSVDALKLRRTPALWLTLAGGALPVVLNFSIFYFKGQYLIHPGQNSWAEYVGRSWSTAAVLLPLFVVLLTSLVVSVEDRAGGWKHLFALPVSRLAVWLSKLLVLLALNLLAHLLFVGLLLAAGYCLQVLRPVLHFAQSAPPFRVIATLLARTYLSTLGILGVQYVLSKWQQGFVLPVAVGMAGWVAGLTLLRWEHVGWVPYAGPYLTLSASGHAPGQPWAVATALAPHEWFGLVWFGAAAVLGYLGLRWRNLA